MVDIPKRLVNLQKEKKSDYLMNLQLAIASNNRSLENDPFNNLVRNLTKNLEEKNDADKLDRNALEALRFMTNMGANKTGGR